MSTIKDVARRTGLSLSTISKYLNGGNVREENRLAIDAAVAELGYSVNVFARSLKANPLHDRRRPAADNLESLFWPRGCGAGTDFAAQRL